jgi:hypothetical protein
MDEDDMTVPQLIQKRRPRLNGDDDDVQRQPTITVKLRGRWQTYATWACPAACISKRGRAALPVGDTHECYLRLWLELVMGLTYYVSTVILIG